MELVLVNKEGLVHSVVIEVLKRSIFDGVYITKCRGTISLRNGEYLNNFKGVVLWNGHKR